MRLELDDLGFHEDILPKIEYLRPKAGAGILT